MNKPVTVLVYLGRGEQGKRRLERWKQAAEDANVTHHGKPAVGKWLKGLAEREIEFLNELEADLMREEQNRKLSNLLYNQLYDEMYGK